MNPVAGFATSPKCRGLLFQAQVLGGRTVIVAAWGAALARGGWQQFVVMAHCHALWTIKTIFALCRDTYGIGLSKQSGTSD